MEKCPAIFTDEPQFCPKAILGAAYEKREIRLPLTDDFAVTYKPKLMAVIFWKVFRNVYGNFRKEKYPPNVTGTMIICVNGLRRLLRTRLGDGVRIMGFA